MGYRAKVRRHEVKLAGEYEGLEATLRGKNLGEFLALLGIGEVDGSDLDNQLREMSRSLISWNLEDENGEPVPATPEAVYEQDQYMMLALAGAWLDAVRGIPAPLEPSSTDGQPFPEASLPMEPLSESLAS